MATLVKSFAIQGIDGYLVDIETGMLEGQPSLGIIGLGDKAVCEAGDRIQAALYSCGYDFPKKRVIINLAPSDRKKSGSHFDLAMALGVLQESDAIGARNIEEYGIIGELSLDGRIRSCAGALPMIMSAKQAGITKIILPAGNLKEASLVQDIEVFGFEGLKKVINFFEGKQTAQSYAAAEHEVGDDADETIDFSEVSGQDELIDAIVLAAAGGHNMLMVGEPGCGKTMIAQRIPTILPHMAETEALEVTKIHSIAGLLVNSDSLVKARPFRAPHHNASLNALIGGGVYAMPGEVSLAHNGVLFLDELTEFPRRILDALRQPIEDKQVTISRVNGSNTFPSSFMFIAAMNPCPCGYHPSKKCRCTDYEIIKYRGKISGPIMDRIDIQKNVHPVGYFEIDLSIKTRSSAELRERVEAAREIQQKRFADCEHINCNAQMSVDLIKQYCTIDESSTELLRNACDAYGYSARVVHKFLRLARTCADLRASNQIEYCDIDSVLSCRDFDKSSSQMLVVR